MLGALAINVIGAVVLYLDERRLDSEFWIAFVVLTGMIWGTYMTGIARGIFE